MNRGRISTGNIKRRLKARLNRSQNDRENGSYGGDTPFLCQTWFICTI